MEKENLVISIKAQQRSNASPVNKMFSAYICRKMSVLPAPNTFSPQTLLTAWTWWQCRCWWSSAALWYLPGRLLPSIPGHSFGCHIDSSCFLFRGLYRNINLSKANTDSVLSHKCSICCGVFFEYFLFSSAMSVSGAISMAYIGSKKEFIQFIRHKYIRHPWCLGIGVVHHSYNSEFIPFCVFESSAYGILPPSFFFQKNGWWQHPSGGLFFRFRQSPYMERFWRRCCLQKKRSLQFLVHRTERAYPIFDKSP